VRCGFSYWKNPGVVIGGEPEQNLILVEVNSLLFIGPAKPVLPVSGALWKSVLPARLTK
jgi:hypothetical protein